MPGRTVRIAAIAALAFVSCGREAGGPISMALRPLAAGNPAATYDVHVFGVAFSCGMAKGNIPFYATPKKCLAAELDTSTQCHIAHARVAPGGTAQFPNIPAGQR